MSEEKRPLDLNDENLKNVAGGDAKITKMFCTSCGASFLWGGDYIGKYWDCPSCGEHWLYGMSYI